MRVIIIIIHQKNSRSNRTVRVHTLLNYAVLYGSPAYMISFSNAGICIHPCPGLPTVKYRPFINTIVDSIEYYFSTHINLLSLSNIMLNNPIKSLAVSFTATACYRCNNSFKQAASLLLPDRKWSLLPIISLPGSLQNHNVPSADPKHLHTLLPHSLSQRINHHPHQFSGNI